MTMLDPKERSARGAAAQADLVGVVPGEPVTPYQGSVRDFIYAEVWTRPGLDLRARFLISIAGAACAGDGKAVESYVRGAIAKDMLSLSEQREGALHLAVYGGWSAGALWDEAVTTVAAALGMAEPEFDPIRAAPWDVTQRHSDGSAGFLEVMKFGGPPSHTAYFEAGILNFVFAEMWCRPGLDQRSRRWVTLVGVGNSSASTPIRSHAWSAMASGNATRDEMLEFVLHYAIHAGWPKASVVQGAVLEQSARVEKGLPFEA